MTRHRLFVVPTRTDVGMDDAVDHWERRHGAIFAATPGLAGYVQHQPTRRDQRRLGGLVCAEAWFADANAEARAFASPYYLATVATDEQRFVDRALAWAPLVRAEEHRGTRPADLPVEVVAVGTASKLPDNVAVRILTVDRASPSGGPSRVVIATVSGTDHARALAATIEADWVFVADRAPVLSPA